MKSIQPFIDLGFYTVPLSGELKRLGDGSKNTPKFEKNWKAKYQNQFNNNASAIGGVITGAISNIIAIDCDDQTTYDMFRALDKSNTFHFVSLGKPSGGGTIIYRYPTGKGLESFSIQSSLMHLDFYSDNGFVYLPTRANSTKEQWEASTFKDLPDLHQLPDTVLLLLSSLQLQYSLAKRPKLKEDAQQQVRSVASYLAPQVELLVSNGKFIPSLFRTITPKDFRDLEQYAKQGYLHPSNVPEGRGSEYLMKVSAILGADPSISETLYTAALGVVNQLWENPVPKKRLLTTVVTPMVEGKSSVNGEPLWAYDEHWKERGIAFTTKLGDAIEVFFDDIKASYYMINYTNDMIKIFYKEAEMFGYIEPISVALPPRKDLKSMCPVVRTSLQPSMPFGFYSLDTYNREFNLFKQNPALSILNDPEPYKDLYKRPLDTIRYLETLIPDEMIRTYVLGFIKKKLQTFNYSPVVLYFLGAHGSGKDTFVSILSAIIGETYVARPSAKEFIEQYNGWFADKYFVQLDEYGNQLHSTNDKETALGKIKAYTGKPDVQIRQMRTDGYGYKHQATFIMTANSNPLIIEDGDRRVCMIDTPNVLERADWVRNGGGMVDTMKRIQNQTVDFAYYLATEVEDITDDAYMLPPETEKKREMIAANMPAARRLAYYFKNSMEEQLEELVRDADCLRVLDHISKSRVYEEDLFDLYTFMTDGLGNKRGLSKIMRDSGYDKIATTGNGNTKIYYFLVPEIREFKELSEFTNQEGEEDVRTSL